MTLGRTVTLKNTINVEEGVVCLFILFLVVFFFFFLNSAQAWSKKHLPIRLSRKQNTSGLNEIREGLT